MTKALSHKTGRVESDGKREIISNEQTETMESRSNSGQKMRRADLVELTCNSSVRSSGCHFDDTLTQADNHHAILELTLFKNVFESRTGVLAEELSYQLEIQN